MGMAECAKTGENARWRGRTARAHPIFDICDFILRSNSLKFQILSPLLPLNLWLDFEKMMHCPFKDPKGYPKKNYGLVIHFQGTQVPPNIARFWTIRYVTLSLKKSMSISLDFADFFCRDS